jgi:hypothetical protein
MAMYKATIQQINHLSGLHRVASDRSKECANLGLFDLSREYETLYRSLAQLARNTRMKEENFNKRFEELISNVNNLHQVYLEEKEKAVAFHSLKESKDGQLELVVDPPKKRGGKRAGAGRKGIGRTEKISLSLPAEEWDYIDSLITDGHVASRAEYIRLLHMSNRYPSDYLIPVPLEGGEKG